MGGRCGSAVFCERSDSAGRMPKVTVSRSSYTTRTKCAISDAFVRDCVFAYCASVVQYVYSLSAEHCFRLRKNAITDERVRDCALSTHSVFRPSQSPTGVAARAGDRGGVGGEGWGARSSRPACYSGSSAGLERALLAWRAGEG